MNKFLYLGLIDGSRYLEKIVPCEYVSADEYEVMEKVSKDERDLIVAYVKISNFKKYGPGKRIYAALTEEQYKQFDECRRYVDFAGIIEGYKSML